MNLYRLRLRPLSPWLTPWQADTLAGLLCWTCARTRGDQALRHDILMPARAGRPLFVLSDAFPGDLLPAPTVLRLFDDFAAERKHRRRRRWLAPTAFQRLQRGEPLTPADLREAPLTAPLQIRNTLDRHTNTTAQGEGLFARREQVLMDDAGYLSIYAWVQAGFEDSLLDLMRELSLVGFGEDTTVGKGQFEVLSTALEAADGILLTEVTGANTVVSLSTFQPAPNGSLDGAWDLFTKHGKLGPDFGVEDVFKRPLVMMRPGACLRSDRTVRHAGRLIPMDELLTQATVSQLREKGLDVAHLAYGLLVPALLPWDELSPPEPSGFLDPPRDRGTTSRRQIVVLIDIEGEARQEEVLGLMPKGPQADPPRWLRATAHGAPRVVRQGPGAAPVPWREVGEATLRLVQAAREAGGGVQVEYWVSGLAPLPVFIHLGMLLSAWVGPQTLVNFRKDGTPDVLPLQGVRTSEPFFDTVSGLSLEQPVEATGRVAVFVSTGLLPERDKLRAFVLEGGAPLSGVVEIRTRSFKFLDQAHAASAADELAQHFSLIAGVYPNQQGIVLFVAGPASLAYLVGRAINPNILGEVWVANRNNEGLSGHELAFVLPLRTSTRSEEEEDAEEAFVAAPASVRIEELRLSHFRSAENACLRLSDLTILCGRNGAGKTTLMEALDFLRDAVTDGLQTAILRKEEIGGIWQRLPDPGQRRYPEVGLAILLHVPDLREEEKDHPGQKKGPLVSQVLYGIRIGDQHLEEVLITAPGDLSFRRLDGKFTSAVTKMRPEPDDLILKHVEGDVPLWGLVMDTLRGLRTYSLSPPKLREEPAPGPRQVVYMDRDGGNAGDILNHLEGEPTDTAWLSSHLAGITPGVLRVRSGGDRGKRLIFFDQQVGDGGDGVLPFRAGDMSDGTLRSLGVLLALRQASRPSLVFIDEIEDSVHPGALGVLLDAAKACVEEGRTQVILTSHSPEVLSHQAVTAERVRIIEWRAGVSRIFNLSQGTKESLGPDTVGDLLRINGLYAEETPCSIADIFGIPDEP